MAGARSHFILGVVLCLGSPVVWAQSVTVNTSLTLNSLTITPSGPDATLNFTTPVVGATYTQAQDSTGGSAYGTTSAIDSPFADASGSTSLSPLGGLVTADITLPDPFAGFASSESIFTLLLPDVSYDPVLFSDNLLTLTGPNQFTSSGGPQPLSTTISLQPNTPYSFTSTLDAEANGYGVLAVPDGSNPVALVLIAVGLSAAFGGLIARKPRLAERG